MATTSVLAVLPASAMTLRTSAALLALHAVLNASSQQDSFKNASTWGSQPKGSAYHGDFSLGIHLQYHHRCSTMSSSTTKNELRAAAMLP